MTRPHYAWIIALSAFLTLNVTNGLTMAGLTVFDEKLLAAFDWSRGTLKFRDLLTFAIAGLSGPFIGILADRYGVRRLMVPGILLLSAGLFAYSQMESSLHLYLIHAVLGISLGCSGLVVCVLLVSRWFVRKRGTAIGLALVGTSLGNTIFPLLNTRLLGSGDWRTAFAWLSLVPLALLPVVFFVIRERPADRGLAPYGADLIPDSSGQPTAPQAGVPYRQALKSRNFWILALVAMLTFYSILAVAAHLFLHLRGLALDPAAASTGLSILFLMGLAGKFCWGATADRVEPRRVFFVNLVVMFAGGLCLASMQPWLTWPAVILFGFGWGGIYTMIQLLCIQSFGLLAAGRILGTITVLDALGGGLGPWVTGLLFDRTGGYGMPFGIIAGLLGLSVLASLVLLQPGLRPHKARVQAKAAC